MDILITIFRFIWIIFLVLMVFNVMIIVHEWGHFLAGRWRGLEIDRFQIWFGKPIWKKTINGVQYGLGSIPAGGFVSLPQMVTMESIEGEVDDEKKRELPSITPLDKIIVAFAGPLFSFLLACVFAVLAWQIQYPHEQGNMTTTVGFVFEDTAAEKAGIQVGDTIQSIDGVQVSKFGGMGDSISWQIVGSEKSLVDFVVDRNGKEMTIPVELPDPKKPEVDGSGFQKFLSAIFSRPPHRLLEIAPRVSPIVAEVFENGPADQAGLKKGDQIVEFEGKVPFTDSFAGREWVEGEPIPLKVKRKGQVIDLTIFPRRPDEFFNYTDEQRAKEDRPMFGLKWSRAGESWLASEPPLTMVTEAAKSIYNTLQKVFSPKSPISGGHLSGPAGIMGLYYDLFTEPNGWRKVLWFSVILNVNLAILNLMPFPVLDGGHIVMATYEWIRRKPLPLKLLEIVQTGFVFLLFGFMIFITFKDIGDRLPWQKKPAVPHYEWNPS